MAPAQKVGFCLADSEHFDANGPSSGVYSQSATGQPESIVIFTTQLRDGNLFYAVAVAPQTDFNAYRGVFDKVIRSIQLME